MTQKDILIGAGSTISSSGYSTTLDEGQEQFKQWWLNPPAQTSSVSGQQIKLPQPPSMGQLIGQGQENVLKPSPLYVGLYASPHGGPVEDKPSTKQVAGTHYNKWAIQPLEYTMKNKLGYCEGSVIKYITRHRDKGGLEDLKKAKHFIELLAEHFYGQII